MKSNLATVSIVPRRPYTAAADRDDSLIIGLAQEQWKAKANSLNRLSRVEEGAFRLPRSTGPQNKRILVTALCREDCS